MKLYQELAEYYYAIEEKHRNIYNDVNMVNSLLQEYHKPELLDLGCGTGEHLHLLKHSCYRSVGVDSSYSMNRIAKLRFPDSAEFIREDIKDIQFTEEFDVVMCLFGSFDYLIENDDVDRVLFNTYRALKPNGIGVFEIWNSAPVKLIKEKPVTHVSVTKYNNIFIERERGFKLLNYADRTIVEVLYNYNISHNFNVKDKHIMRAFSREEIEDFILRNGFEIISFYSNSKKDQFKDISNKIIVHFKKA